MIILEKEFQYYDTKHIKNFIIEFKNIIHKFFNNLFKN